MSSSYANGNRYFYFMQLSVIHLHLWIINSNQAWDASELFILIILKYICMNFQINSLTINDEKCENFAPQSARASSSEKTLPQSNRWGTTQFSSQLCALDYIKKVVVILWLRGTVWKFHDFSAIYILREINWRFSHFIKHHFGKTQCGNFTNFPPNF